MKAITLQNFRLAQSIVKSVYNAQTCSSLAIEPSDYISLNGEGVVITEVYLNKDAVVCMLYNHELEFCMPIRSLADDVVADVTKIMMDYAVQYSNNKIVADESGNVTEETWRI